ncbi:MAG: hypothetical protein J6R22_00145 [Alphaproteobacteria bacterium]|nr:hypothetical protein [Alphaproteobacteria bacterium]
MKPTMLFAIMAMISIVLMSAFNLTLLPAEGIRLSAANAASALYVCPADGGAWTAFAKNIHPFAKPVSIIFIFCIILLIFSWSWALYQNLLKDKFNRDSYKQPWAYTKMLFWAGVIVTMLFWTPNHFRSVRVTGLQGDWVLCQSNTPGAKAVRASAVHR